MADAKGLPAWSHNVAQTAALTVRGALFRGPVQVTMRFVFKRPASMKPTRKNWREHMTVPPDVDKLARAVLDACTSTVYPDDSLVTGLHATKEYGPVAGAEIVIAELCPL